MKSRVSEILNRYPADLRPWAPIGPDLVAPIGGPMPLPLIVGRINRRLTSPILWPVVARLPRSGFGRIVHVGRRSARVYRTPMLGFRHGDRLVFALTYGPRTQWVQNVLAAGECDFETRSGTHHLIQPRLFYDPDRGSVPALVGWILGRLKAHDFFEMRVSEAGNRRAGQDRADRAELIPGRSAGRTGRPRVRC